MAGLLSFLGRRSGGGVGARIRVMGREDRGRPSRVPGQCREFRKQNWIQAQSRESSDLGTVHTDQYKDSPRQHWAANSNFHQTGMLDGAALLRQESRGGGKVQYPSVTDHPEELIAVCHEYRLVGTAQLENHLSLSAFMGWRPVVIVYQYFTNMFIRFRGTARFGGEPFESSRCHIPICVKASSHTL